MIGVLRAGFEGTGSPRWLISAMRGQAIDTAHGFRVELVVQGEGNHRHGTLGALAAGAIDLADADWLALAAARADGLPITAIHPYGRILGTLVARRGVAWGDQGDASDVDDADAGRPFALGALPGARLAVRSTADKNWLILAAALRRARGLPLEALVQPVPCASRTALVKALDDGAADFALVHWHLVPALLERGHRVACELPDLARALSPGEAPTTYFVTHERLATSARALLGAFVGAAGQTMQRLRDEPALWHTLLPAADGHDPALTDALRARWLARIGHAPAWHAGSRHELAGLARAIAAPSACDLFDHFDPHFLP